MIYINAWSPNFDCEDIPEEVRVKVREHIEKLEDAYKRWNTELINKRKTELERLKLESEMVAIQHPIPYPTPFCFGPFCCDIWKEVIASDDE